MTSSSHITTCSLLFILSLKSALGAINLTDLVISDYDFNDPDNDRVSCTDVHWTHIFCQRAMFWLNPKSGCSCQRQWLFRWLCDQPVSVPARAVGDGGLRDSRREGRGGGGRGQLRGRGPGAVPVTGLLQYSSAKVPSTGEYKLGVDKYLILELRGRSNSNTHNEKKDNSSFLAFFLN